jgi:hypothetical protein
MRWVLTPANPNSIPTPTRHYSCCTANYQQGWPKYVNNLFLVGADSALVVAMLAPFTATHAGSTVVVDTHYPFGDTATITVTGAAATLKVS